ncbi:hypothetical protein [Lactiplantibacillus plantarum]|uniref:hypothetical protein n=1 Tax=Lactiplantibacillus plantarum TaxID=1590 RepID=UPI0015EBA318|nr:hypothetical protein [Lactiplantibacillus plantarum]MBA3076675.1 hypothetical protein [Lactiplantibacillus plantarum]MBA3082475.1 hypothetical protein [Lactiplantibacillus plantarum]MCC9313518.1 hypothetical protein [Lactiplantibacillus plantarum]MDF3264364.1 hypothetical protein [Lactiplantibacillus plantarum]MDO1602841.1 hypothetical protein [Lactiplantibacillus plantarum]
MDKDMSKYELIDNITNDLTSFINLYACVYLTKDSYSRKEYGRIIQGMEKDMVDRLKQK